MSNTHYTKKEDGTYTMPSSPLESKHELADVKYILDKYCVYHTNVSRTKKVASTNKSTTTEFNL